MCASAAHPLDTGQPQAPAPAALAQSALRALSKIYSSLYYIDVPANRFTEIGSLSAVQEHIGASGNAQDRLDYFARNMVTPPYVEDTFAFVQLATLGERLANQRIDSHQYESALLLGPGGTHNWSQCSFIEVDRSEDGALAHVLFATEPIAEAKRAEIIANQGLQESNDQLSALLEQERLHTSVINALSGVFYALYLIDLPANSMRQMISTGPNARVYGTELNAREFLANAVETYVMPEYRAEAQSFLDLDTLDSRMLGSDILSLEYVVRTGSWTRASLIPASYTEGGQVDKLLFCLRNISTEKEQAATLQSLIQALALPYQNIYLINAETGLTTCYRMGQVISERFGSLFEGTSFEDNIALYVEREVYEEDRPLFDKVFHIADILELLKDSGSYSFTYRVSRDGGIQHYQLQVVQSLDSSSEFVIAFKNVDAMVREEQEHLRIQAEQARELKAQSEVLEGLGSEYYSVLLVDPHEDSVTTFRATGFEGRAIDEYFRVRGHRWSQGIKTYAEERVSAASRAEFLEKLSLEHLLGDGEDYSFTYEYTYSGDIVYLQARVSFVWEAEGRCVAVIGTRNVDDLIKRERQQEQALQEAFDAAEAANKAKTDFLSNMSHDIRTPMNGIIGMTAIAAANIDDPERVRDCLGKITQASKHLLSLINEVLDMSKIESGKVELVEEEFNLSDLVDNLLTMTAAQVEKHGHELSVSIANVEHEEVIGDALRIQKVFTNLLGNAVKYTPDGGRIRLEITEKPCNQSKVACYEFVFEDNGIGMAPEFIEHIFEPFARAQDTRVNKIQGTGLGMPISRNIVRMMGGDIEVESAPGVGSRFTVTIYLKLQDHDACSHERFVDLDVLVADDDELSLDSCCAMLNDMGMRAEGVDCGTRAVQRVVEQHAAKRDYFACILDWKMPDMNGVETARAIRREVGEDVPIIIISAYDWSDIEQEARAAGVNAFISKPLFRSRLERTFSVLTGEVVEEPALAEGDFDGFANLSLAGKRALLAEDNALNAEVAMEILKTTGLEVEHAEDGVEAADMVLSCEDGYYDIILMDIQMPRMNGYDATRAIRASRRPYCKQVPILAMTANAFAEDVQAAKTVGMNEHLSKPLELPALARALTRWLR
ncbi:MAG: hybrid sensor histidine kinase/response regulator [Coriobacteriales bacterium]